jgi:lipoprotein NlpD
LRLSRSICAVGLCCLLLGACAETAGSGLQSYVVRPQDTLYSIAWRHDLDYRDLARWNNIGADFRISVGQVLVLGPGAVTPPESGQPRVAPVPRPTTPAAAVTGSHAQDAPQVGKPRPLPDPQPGASSSATQTAPNPRGTPIAPTTPRTPNGPDARAAAGDAISTAKWVWPTDHVGAPRRVPGGGILLSGRLGQDIRAASAGRVVYAGSGLRGYGNLIIIKHADSLLSAYAHNREMLVHDGQEVGAGQVIAHMGESTQQSPILYFEIRQNGRPIDPLPFMSRMK